jgi:hypothetical protein
LAGKCSAITRGGTPCRGLVRAGNDYCPAHDPARQEARRRAASKAGKSKPGRELAEIKGRLSALADAVLDGSVEKGVGAVVSQVLNVYLSAVRVELKVREVEELAARMDEIEERLERQGQGRRWG